MKRKYSYKVNDKQIEREYNYSLSAVLLRF